MRKILIIFLASVFVLLPTSFVHAGNSISNAVNISMGGNYNGTISETNSENWYRFTLSSSGRVTLRATAGISRIYYLIYNSAGNQVWYTNKWQNSTTGISSTNETIDLTKGTYYFIVLKDSGTGNYSFRLSFASANESFVEMGEGENNSLDRASQASVNTFYRGQIAENDGKDFYRFTLTLSGRITLTATAEINRIYYRIYDSNGSQVWYTNKWSNSTTGISSTSETIDLTKGTYYFIVEKNSGTGNYSFQLSFANANESFSETENGTNNTIYTANAIVLNRQYKGQIAENDEKDFYKFTMGSPGEIRLTAMAEISRVYYRIYDRAGNQVWYINEWWNSTTGKSSTSESIALSAGTYYFIVEEDSSTGNYSFTLSTGSPGGETGGGSGTTPTQNWKNASKYTLLVSQGMWMDKSGLTGNIVWRSSNPRVASVNFFGRVYARKPGTAIISASVGGKVFKSVIKVNSVLLVSRTKLSMRRNGGRRAVTVTLRAGRTVRYRIKNAKCVSCYWGRWQGNKCALFIYPRKKGKAVITFTNSYNAEKKKVTVRVR